MTVYGLAARRVHAQYINTLEGPLYSLVTILFGWIVHLGYSKRQRRSFDGVFVRRLCENMNQCLSNSQDSSSETVLNTETLSGLQHHFLSSVNMAH